jgi:FMN phosphatase YigB (HAD superfamily)
MALPGPRNQIVSRNGITIFCDSDEILTEFHNPFNEFLRKNGYDAPHGWIPKLYSYRDIMLQEEFDRMFALFGKDWPARVPAYDGASEFLRQLKILGCHVVVVTSIPGEQGPERILNFCKHGFFYDEIFFTMGRKKSDFINAILPRYSNSKGGPTKNILVDDHARNCVEFVTEVPNSVAITMQMPYGEEWLEKSKEDKRIKGKSKNQQEVYAATLKYVTKVLLSKVGNKKEKNEKI